MKKQSLLKQFYYSIPASVLVTADSKLSHAFSEQLPLMAVSFDFENGKMKLEGEWDFMMASNRHNEANWFTAKRNRVKIIMDIVPAAVINISNDETDGMVLPIEGYINDGESIGGCSGLIVIDNVKQNKEHLSNLWDISFYVYDLQYEFCEIKFKLPLNINSLDEHIN